MRLVHVMAPAPFGGAERVVAGLTQATVSAGHEVTLLLALTPGSDVPSWAKALVKKGVDVEPLVLPARAYLRERSAVREILRLRSAQLLHTHGYRSDVLHATVAKQEGLPCVSTAHGFASASTRGSLYEWLQMRSWRSFDTVVAVSHQLESILIKSGVPSDKVLVIPNGFVESDAPLLSRGAARKRLELPAEAPVVGWVGRFSAEKDPIGMVRAFSRITNSEAFLCMVGDGPLRDDLRAAAGAEGLGKRAVFPGAQPEAGTLLAAFDVLALSSLTEGTPMVVLEAAHAGVPVVATSVGGVPDLLADRAGWLVRPTDARALASALVEAMNDPNESRRRAAMLKGRLTEVSHGRDWVARYLVLYEHLLRP